ncbi:MAG: YbaK/EbsC family protein, partial [Pseudomonadota bacterium]|nr:YbaK/EbsC family protein [Pseudomonadota bacterium]
IEVAPVKHAGSTSEGKALNIEEFATPGQKTIADLEKSTGVPANKLVKTLFYSASDTPKDLKPIAVLLLGSDELNPIKLKNLLGLTNPPLMLTDAEVKAASGAFPGSCGPVGLKIPIYMDQAVAGLSNFIVGANKDGFHIKNVNIDRDFKAIKTGDIRLARQGDPCPNCEGKYESHRGIEVGHVFYLGTKYSKMLKAEYLDDKGARFPIEMGCYGIGVTRTLQAAVEQSHDKDGIIWPLPLAPFAVHICLLDPGDSETAQVSEKIYQELGNKGVDIFVDDREERPGVKFKDADLLGMPLRIIIGQKGLKSGKLEVVERKTKAKHEVAPGDVVSFVNSWLEQEMKKSNAH